MATNLQDVIARLEAEIASAKATGSRIGSLPRCIVG